KFTDTGAITLRVSRLPSRPSEVAARFEVADTGIGVGADAARVLFQPFMQDVSTGRAEQGTGLGLAIAKSLVQMMGGEIGGVGTPGQGSTFWFTIRVDAAREPAGGGAPAREALAGVDQAHGRVLVADDNAVNRMVTVALLEEAGCAVETVSTGREAVD